jgi:hypothetical protein
VGGRAQDKEWKQRRLSRACWLGLVVVAATALAGAGIAQADDVIADGDEAAPVLEHILDFGDVCVGEEYVRHPLVVVRRTNVTALNTSFADGAVVTIETDPTRPAEGAGISASGLGTVTLPSNWVSIAFGTASDPVEMTIKLVPEGLGAQTGAVYYDAYGKRALDETTIVRRGPASDIQIVWNAVTCAPTDMPPTISLPDSIVVDATSPGGANVTFAASATDDIDGSLPVSCLPTSGAVFPIGSTTVTCGVVDSSGHEVTASFGVLVRGAPEQIADLVDKVRALRVSAPLSLTCRVALTTAAGSLIHRRKAMACGALNVFIVVVRSQAGRTIPLPKAAELIEDARRIRSVVGC